MDEELVVFRALEPYSHCHDSKFFTKDEHYYLSNALKLIDYLINKLSEKLGKKLRYFLIGLPKYTWYFQVSDEDGAIYIESFYPNLGNLMNCFTCRYLNITINCTKLKEILQEVKVNCPQHQEIKFKLQSQGGDS